MKTTELNLADFEGVFAVPPLARNRGPERTINQEENAKIIRHMEQGGLVRIMYGGNAVFYHITLREFETVLGLAAELAARDTLVIPSVGPSFGRAMDQAEILEGLKYPAVMYLPVNDPKDEEGLCIGISEFVQRSGTPVILYIKSEKNMSVNQAARLFENGSAAGIKYAIVRQDPAKDDYLRKLVDHVDRRRIISGIGERPAPDHLLKFDLPAYTTGCGCLAPRATSKMFHYLRDREPGPAARIRQHFLPLEDLRDKFSPIRVLHAAFAAAGVAETGPVPPMFSDLPAECSERVTAAARALLEFDTTLA